MQSCTENKPFSGSRMRFLMNTFCRIEAEGQDAVLLEEGIEEAFAQVRRIEKLLSRFRDDSQVYRINKSACSYPQTIDEELFFLIRDCLRFSQESGGAFDITIAPLMDLWRSAKKEGPLPLDEAIRALLGGIGYQKVILDENNRSIFFKSPQLKIDLGAVGKGYALDRAVEVLKNKNIAKARLDFGGHLYYLDCPQADAEPIGIRNPFQPQELITSITLKNQSVSTSANYERNFEIRGCVYGHLIDPLTGYPVDSGILSVSVISDSAIASDVLSTAVFVLGLEKGLALIKKISDASAIIITNNNGKPQIHSSRNQSS